LLGYIENRGTDLKPNFVSVIKHYKTGEWHVIDDHEISSIDEKSVLENNATIILYKKKMGDYQIKTMNNLKSQVKLLKKNIVVMKDEELAYIPNYWYEKSISLASPGMIHSCHLFCKHGRVKPSYFDCFPLKKGSNPNSSMLSSSMLDNSIGMERSFINLDGADEFGVYTKNFIEKQSIRLPRPLAEYFLETYGGGPLINEIDICEECTSEAVQVKKRKRLERELINRLDSKSIINYFF
jgi:ubiquitin carboxyl-terminal hydrolase 20/33